MMGPRESFGGEKSELSESEIRAQLAQILASDTFVRSERLTVFLRFIVERALEGEAATLKEQVLVSELYGRGPDFDTRLDPVVRVDARRLRDKLREYYAEHPDDPVLIKLPKGRYAPDFEKNPGAMPLADPTKTPEARPGAPARLWKIGTAVAVVAAIMVWAWLVPGRRLEAPRQMAPLTSFPGNEGQASLSPDGNFVAFACTAPEQSAQADICIKAVGTEVVQRLTETPEAEYWPAWSPDGSEILFGRGGAGSGPAYQEFRQELGIFAVSRMGGPERKLSDTGAIARWTPDGKSLLVRDRLIRDEPYAIFQLDLRTQARRRLTQPSTSAGDWLLDVSPDGSTLAFIRVGRPGLADLFVVPTAGGEPRRLTNLNENISGFAWMPDSRELIYTLEGRLWRISSRLEQPGRGEPIPDVPMQAAGVSISRPGGGRPVRLVFANQQSRINLRRIDLSSADGSGVFRRILPFAPATRFNSPGRFSPDGAMVGFVSNRASKDTELWIANSDGSEPRQLTNFGSARGMLAGAWSPDGKRILFDAAVNGNHDLYVIPADGGVPVRLTTQPGLDLMGAWSKDSRWIYYAAEERAPGPGSNLWRISAQGGSPPEQITKAGGFDPQFSPDGEHLFYLDRSPLAGKTRLMKMPASSGEGEAVLSDMTPFLWCVASGGVYFLREESSAYSLHQYRFSDAKIERVGILRLRLAGFQAPGRLSVSPDGSWALVNVREPAEGDLMLIENFH